MGIRDMKGENQEREEHLWVGCLSGVLVASCKAEYFWSWGSGHNDERWGDWE